MKTAIALTAFVISLAAAASAGAQTYTFNQTVGGGSASGTITTDNTLGVLSTSNITGFNITINDGSNTFLLTNANGQALISGSALTATANGLFFNFDLSDTNFALFQNPYTSSGINYFCLQTTGCYGPFLPGVGLRLQDAQQTNTLQGNVQFATLATGAVPEPATWALMLVGFGAVGYAMRRRPTLRVRYA